MQYFFTPAKFLPEGVGFPLYGKAHLCWLAALAVMCAGMVIVYRRMDGDGRRRFARVVAGILLVSEVLRDGIIILQGGWKWNYLPLHPCSFTMYIIAIWAWKPNRFCGHLLYGFGLAGALAALLFCDWTDQPLWQFQTLHSFLFHGILVGFVLMTLLSGDIRPEAKGFFACMGFLFAAALGTAIVNNTLPDCNFFFTHAGSEGSPLTFFIQTFGYPWWLGAYGALAVCVVGAEFLPWHWVHKAQTADKF